MREKFHKLIDGLSSWNVSVSDEQLRQLWDYYNLLIEKNKVMNLTTITEFSEVVEKHFLDSLSLCQVTDLSQSLEVLDLGTGAGFPGIPLKIFFPELNITLMDSLSKRIVFLTDVIDDLELSGIEAVHARAEEAARNKYFREKYDLCVSRAVANLTTLSEYCLPFVKVGGRFISYKSADIDEELFAGKNGIEKLGGVVSDVPKFLLPGTQLHRSLVVIDKSKATPRGYPRKPGTPAKEPLT